MSDAIEQLRQVLKLLQGVVREPITDKMDAAIKELEKCCGQ